MSQPAGGAAPAGPPPAPPDVRAPREPCLRLFCRFLRFGLLAWGGPVAQIALIRQELVEQERWITRAKFNRVLAVYQALPGPEAHELCCYFGMLSRGRLGSILAGLGFMLPGLLLMLLMSWVYVTWGLLPALVAAFAGMQPIVAAMIVRAVHRIGSHALSRPWLWIFAALGAALALWQSYASGGGVASDPTTAPPLHQPSHLALLITGLRGGLLTFGGAYTAIPFVQADAVGPGGPGDVGGWMTQAQFLDGLAIGSILPAPLVIFATFVGYLGAGLAGALLVTLGMFAPAFSFTLIGHDLIEHAVENRRLHAILDAIAAAVVGVIAVTALTITLTALRTPLATGLFAGALAALYLLRGRAIIPILILLGGLAGLLFLYPF